MAMKNNDFKQCWESVFTFFASEAAFKEDITDSMKDMWNLDDKLVKQWYEAAVYQGFDVKAFLTILLKNRKEFYDEEPREETWQVNYDSAGQTRNFSYTSTESFMKDMCFIILIFL